MQRGVATATTAQTAYSGIDWGGGGDGAEFGACNGLGVPSLPLAGGLGWPREDKE
jgi:hypothetical protein